MIQSDQKKNRQSKHRERILELLRSTDTHPTADWVYDQLKKEYPQLSLGTVYRNLTILLEMGLAKKIHFGSTYDRFEAKTEPHYHLICESCGKIQSIHMIIMPGQFKRASAHSTTQIQSSVVV